MIFTFKKHFSTPLLIKVLAPLFTKTLCLSEPEPISLALLITFIYNLQINLVIIFVCLTFVSKFRSHFSNLQFHQLVVSWHSCLIGKSFHQHAISWVCYFIKMSFYQFVISSVCHFINMSFHQHVISSDSYFTNLFFNQQVIHKQSSHFIN